MKITYFTLAIIFCIYCISCNNVPKERPIKKVVIKGIFTHKTDYGLIPETGSKVYALEKQYVDNINDTLLSRFNWIWYAYIEYLKLDDKPWGRDLAQKWKKEVLAEAGIKSDKDYDTAMSQTVRYGMSIENSLETKETTINGNGEYELHLDSGRYFVLVNSSDGTGGYYGRWVTTYDSITDFSENLWYSR